MVAVAVLDHKSYPDVPDWQADIDLARYMFQNILAQNPLSSRCARILNIILPPGPQTAQSTGPMGNSWFDSGMIDTTFWQAGPDDVFNSVNWPNFEQTC